MENFTLLRETGFMQVSMNFNLTKTFRYTILFLYYY